MTISDILTLITLLLAFIALISERSRKHLLLKFGIIEYLICILLFLFINYFVFIDEFEKADLIINSQYFKNFGLSSPKHYSYIISLILLFYIIYKANWGFYKYGKYHDVDEYYKSLLFNGEISYLLDLIERYHLSDIKRYLNLREQESKKIPEKISWRQKEPTLVEKIKSKISLLFSILFSGYKANRLNYARSVLFEIINNPQFLNQAVKIRPYFFAGIQYHFKGIKKHTNLEHFNANFMRILVFEKNYWLIHELKEFAYSGDGLPILDKSNIILSSLLKDLSASDNTTVYNALRDAALQELHEESQKERSIFLNEHKDDEQLWQSSVYIATYIHFLIVEEAIRINYKYHFWVHHLRRITEELIAFCDERCGNKKQECIYHEIIRKIIVQLRYLTCKCFSYENEIYLDVIKTFSKSLYAVVESLSVSDEMKIKCVSEFFFTYFDSYNEEDYSNRLRQEMISAIKKPTLDLMPNLVNFNNFILTSWNIFDKLPYDGSSINDGVHPGYLLLKNHLDEINN